MNSVYQTLTFVFVALCVLFVVLFIIAAALALKYRAQARDTTDTATVLSERSVSATPSAAASSADHHYASISAANPYQGQHYEEVFV